MVFVVASRLVQLSQILKRNVKIESCLPGLRNDAHLTLGLGLPVGITRSQPQSHDRGFRTCPPLQHDDEQKRKAKIFYFVSPLRWLTSKIGFYLVKNELDSSFSSEDFKEGSKQAISTILTHIAKNQLEELKGLVRENVITEVIGSLPDILKGKRILLKISPEDIYAAVANQVTLLESEKACIVDMQFISLKEDVFSADMQKPVIIVLEIGSRFYRDFSLGELSEWMVTKLQISARPLMRENQQ